MQVPQLQLQLLEVDQNQKTEHKFMVPCMSQLARAAFSFSTATLQYKVSLSTTTRGTQHM